MEIEACEPVREAPQRRGVYPFAAGDDGQHVPEIKPGHIVVRRCAGR